MKDLSIDHKQFLKSSLDESKVKSDPFDQLRSWLKDAMDSEVAEPLAMTLSTVSAQNIPSSRVVYLREMKVEGLVFFSNYQSRKAEDMQVNPHVSLLFFWPELQRQVRVEGSVSKTTSEVSDQYFSTRPEASQLSAIVSPQSREIPDREWLDKQAEDKQTEGSGYKRPEYWGGYSVKPNYFEFWQGRDHRLHDRIAFKLHTQHWRRYRLAP